MSLSLLTGAWITTDTSPTVFRAEYLRIKSEYEHHVYIYTDGSKSGEQVAAAAVTDQLEFKCRLADNASIFTAEPKEIELALSEIETTQGEDFVIFSDSMSSLQALDYLIQCPL